MKKKISLLGSTGSIGTQALQVCENMGYQVVALTAGSNIKLLEEQVRKWQPIYVAIAEERQLSALKCALADLPVKIGAGQNAVVEAAALAQSDVVLNSVVGIAGLRPTLAALEAGKPLALANKESLVTGGALVMKAAEKAGVPILPVDSEHSAIFQCLQAGRREQLRSVVLTASGGPFHGKTKEQLRAVTKQDALQHPNWNMGSKITIDSATMMNKGLEFIEAMWLFDLKPEQIEIVIHRQSVLHSAVEFLDSSVIAQMGVPDMRCAIQYALTYPEHLPADIPKLSLPSYGTLTFEEPDIDTFQCLGSCIEAACKGGLAACIANGANEEAVRLFLEDKLSFLHIGQLVAGAVSALQTSDLVTLEAIEQADQAAREYVLSKVEA